MATLVRRILPAAIHAAVILVTVLQQTAPAEAQPDLEASLSAEKARLDSLENTLEASRKRLERTTTAAESSAERLHQLEREVFLTRREHGRLARREQEMSTRVRATREVTTSMEARVQARQTALLARLRDMYKRSRVQDLEILFSAGSLTEGVRRLQYLSKAASQDRRDFEGLRADRLRLRRSLTREQKEHAHQRSLLKTKKKAEQTLAVMYTEQERRRKRLLSNRDTERQRIAATETSMEEVGQRILELVQEIERRRRQGGRLVTLPEFDFSGHRGQLAWPVSGAILSRFGRHQDPELKTWTFHRGINISAAADVDVISVAPGEVMVVDWYRGYGQFVLLRHPGGFYSLYAHLGSVRAAVGEILAEGAVVGTVGDSGRLDGVPQLHFEVIQGEDAVDPVEWLE